ncbi:MAG: small basic protein [Planctomycetota bacterium]|jgi:small basic protein (TIGR04137 family)
MSIHSSLKISGGLVGSRNVWTRMERLQVLKQEGRWQDGDSVLGLPKVRTQFKSKSKKQLKASAAEATTEGEAAEGEAAADASGSAT